MNAVLKFTKPMDMGLVEGYQAIWQGRSSELSHTSQIYNPVYRPSPLTS